MYTKVHKLYVIMTSTAIHLPSCKYIITFEDIITLFIINNNDEQTFDYVHVGVLRHSF